MRCRASHIILPSNLKQKVRYQNGDTGDIIQTILEMDARADQFVNKTGVDCLRGKTNLDTMRNVWRFVKGNIRYKPDKSGYEVVKSPAALFNVGQGDCKSFSIAVAALLRALGFKDVRYRFAAYRAGGDFTHVYVVSKLGGKMVILDAVHDFFNEEVQYKHIKDIPAPGARAGIGKPSPSSVAKPSFLPLVAMGLAAYLFAK